MTRQFNDKEYQGLMFNIITCPMQKSLLRHFPRLNKVPAIKNAEIRNVGKNNVLRYIILNYDKNSPFRKKYQNILKRKVEAAKEAGFIPNKEGFLGDDVEPILKCQNTTVNKMIVEYVRLHRSYVYSSLVTKEEGFYTLMKEIIGGGTKRLKEFNEMEKELEDAVLELLNQDDNPYLKDAVLRYMEEERLKLRPEDIADKVKNGESDKSFKKVS